MACCASSDMQRGGMPVPPVICVICALHCVMRLLCRVLGGQAWDILDPVLPMTTSNISMQWGGTIHYFAVPTDFTCRHPVWCVSWSLRSEYELVSGDAHGQVGDAVASWLG